MATLLPPVLQSDTFEIQRQKINGLAADVNGTIGTITTALSSSSPGIARAWVQFAAISTGITILSQYNVSSMIRHSTGIYTINFTIAMPSINYIVVGSGIQNGNGGPNGGNTTIAEYWTNGYGLDASSQVRADVKTVNSCKIVSLDTDVGGRGTVDTIGSVVFYGA